MDNIIFFISVFLAGILSFFSPCILPLLPVYGGILLYDKDGAQASSGKFSISVVSLLRTQAFIAGISFLLLALVSSSVLKHFRKLHPYLGTLKKVGGFLIIVMGILVLLGNASILTTLFE